MGSFRGKITAPRPSLVNWQDRMPSLDPLHPERPAATLTELSVGNPDIFKFAIGETPREAMVESYGEDDVMRLEKELQRVASLTPGFRQKSLDKRYLDALHPDIRDNIKQELKSLKAIDTQKLYQKLKPQNIERIVQRETTPSPFNVLALGGDIGRTTGKVATGLAQDLVGRAKALTSLVKGAGRDEARRTYEESMAKPWINFDQNTSPGGKLLDRGLGAIGQGFEWLEDKAKSGMGRMGMDPGSANDALAVVNTLLAAAPVGGLATRAARTGGTIARSALRVPVKTAQKLSTTVQDTAAASDLADLFKAPVAPLNVSEAIPQIPTKVATSIPGVAPVEKFFNSFAGMPDAADYVASRNTAKGIVGMGQELAEPYLKELNALPEEARKNIFRAIDEGGAETLAAPEQALLAKTQDINNVIGQSMVDRGYLDPEAFKALEGQYATRKYAMYDNEGMGAAPSRIETDVFKERSAMTPEQRRARGLYEDIAPVQEGYIKTSLETLAKDTHMRNVAENPEWVWRPPEVDVLGEKIPAAELDAQIRLQKEIYKKLPGPEVAARLQALEDAKLTVPGAPGGDFVKVPDTPSWGPLQGTYVRRPIYEDMADFLPETTRSTGVNPGIGRAIANVAEKGIATFKVAKTAFNIPSWGRNMLEGFVRMDLSGIPVHKIIPYYAKAMTSLGKGNPNYKLAKAGGLFESGFDAEELRPALKALGEKMTLNRSMLNDGWFGAAAYFANDKMLQPILKMTKGFSGIYQAPDNVAKYAMFLANKDAGLSNAEAVLRASKWGMDYSAVNPTIKTARRFWLPFVSYNYKMAPLLAEVAAERPWKFMKYAAAPSVFNAAMEKMSGNFSNQEVNAIMDIYPREVQKQGSPYILPTRSPSGKIRFVSVDYMMPWGNFLSAARGAQSGDWREAARIISMGNPIMDTYSMIAASKGEALKDLFTGKPLYNPLDSTLMKTYKLTTQLVGNLAIPSYLMHSGAVPMAIEKFRGEGTKRDKSWADVVSTMCGVGTKVLDPAQLERTRSSAEKNLTTAWNEYDATTNDSPEERQKKFEEYIGLRMSLNPELRQQAGDMQDDFVGGHE